MNACLFVCLFLASCTCHINVQAAEASLSILHDELFGTSLEDHFKVSSDYRNDLMPISEWGTPLHVFLGLNMVSFAGLDVATGVLRLNAWLRLKWADRRLAFNGTKLFGASWDKDVDHVPVPSEKLWTPDVMHLGAAEEASAQVTEQLAYLYDADFLNATGYNIFWSRAIYLSKVCDIDLRHFPFDRQECQLVFGSWGHNARQVLLRPMSEAGDLSVDATQSDVLDPLKVESIFSYKIDRVIVGSPVDQAYTTMKSRFSEVTFTVVLRRQAHHVVTHVVCPVSLLVVLSILAFWLPEKGGERVSYAVTVLFTLLAIITFSSDLRPHSGVSTWLDTFQSTCIVLTSLPVVQTVFFVSSFEVLDDDEPMANMDDDHTPLPSLESFKKDFPLCCWKRNSRDRQLRCQQLDLVLRVLYPLLVLVALLVLFVGETPDTFDMLGELFGKTPHLMHNSILLIFFVLLVSMGMRWFVFGILDQKNQKSTRSRDPIKNIQTPQQTCSTLSDQDSNQKSAWSTTIHLADEPAQSTEWNWETFLFANFPLEVHKQLQELTMEECADLDESDLNAMCLNLSVKKRLMFRRACKTLRMRGTAVSELRICSTLREKTALPPLPCAAEPDAEYQAMRREAQLHGSAWR
eukprot:gnl/MRDRNA2_/MRDRNA2_120854_c0_seq1.p1 gnl/MRDRNA2_/MRDRNA2_120854_c0~~gnl/MRDRNA2_/MRDRNA2_120854_c0_seq1.p1  ORF type:complete len:633 (+),score=97.62 gnl/MRDRNA2_/MRDRNA2_120854_c0_seq1:53-1951(+)